VRTKTLICILAVFILCSFGVVHADYYPESFLNRDYTLFLIAETKIIDIKNFVDFMSIKGAGSEQFTEKAHRQLLELKKIELKQAIIEEMKIAGRYVFERKKFSKKQKEWRNMSLNHMMMERNLVTAPFKEIWQERLWQKPAKAETTIDWWLFSVAVSLAVVLGYFLGFMRCNLIRAAKNKD